MHSVMVQTPLLLEDSSTGWLHERRRTEVSTASDNVSLTICSCVLPVQMAELSLTDCHEVQNTSHVGTCRLQSYLLYLRYTKDGNFIAFRRLSCNILLNPLKFAVVPQTDETISAASGLKFTILWGRVEEILLLNKFLLPIVDTCLSCEDTARQSCAMMLRWRSLRPVFQRAAFSTAHFR